MKCKQTPQMTNEEETHRKKRRRQDALEGLRRKIKDEAITGREEAEGRPGQAFDTQRGGYTA